MHVCQHKIESLDGQIDTLEEYGCERIFSEKASGRKTKRTELDKCLDYLREGDILVVYKLDASWTYNKTIN